MFADRTMSIADGWRGHCRDLGLDRWNYEGRNKLQRGGLK